MGNGCCSTLFDFSTFRVRWECLFESTDRNICSFWGGRRPISAFFTLARRSAREHGLFFGRSSRTEELLLNFEGHRAVFRLKRAFFREFFTYFEFFLPVEAVDFGPFLDLVEVEIRFTRELGSFFARFFSRDSSFPSNYSSNSRSYMTFCTDARANDFASGESVTRTEDANQGLGYYTYIYYIARRLSIVKIGRRLGGCCNARLDKELAQQDFSKNIGVSGCRLFCNRD